MSMHAIESLVEYSVITVATALPVPPLAQSICHSLYHLQNQLDCGYTVLRVRDELEKVGYLSLLSPEQLPEPERSEAMELAAEGGFLKGGGIMWIVVPGNAVSPQDAYYGKSSLI